MRDGSWCFNGRRLGDEISLVIDAIVAVDKPGHALNSVSSILRWAGIRVDLYPLGPNEETVGKIKNQYEFSLEVYA